MEKLRVRCPQCTKLYQVDSSDIESETPHFKCVVCGTAFYFQYPSVSVLDIDGHPREILTYRVGEVVGDSSSAKISPANAERFKPENQRSCPKCGAINASSSQECHSCRVIFARLEGLPQDRSLGAQPSLVRRWTALLKDFDNEILHEDFIKACSELGALRYALKQYQDLLAVTGNDPLCLKRIALIQGEMQIQLHRPFVPNKVEAVTQTDLEKLTHYWELTFDFFAKYWLVLCYLGAILIVLVGFFSAGQRNWVGVGTALLLLIGGVHSIVKGKISF